MEEVKVLRDLAEAVANGDDDMVRDLTNTVVAAGVSPLTIINEGLTKGIGV